MQIHIIDPALIGKAGHYYDIDIRLAQELASRGHQVQIYAHRQFALLGVVHNLKNVKIIPVFSHSPNYQEQFPIRNDPWAGELRYFHQATHLFGEELKRLAPADIWILPTVFPYQLMALSRHDILPFVIGCLHNHPESHFKQGKMLWRLAFLETQKQANRIKLGILEQEILLEFEQLLASDAQYIHAWPIPHDGVPSKRLRTGLLTVGLLGHQRNRKGLERLPQTVNTLIKLGYEVILHDSSGRLSAQAKTSKNLRIFHHVPVIGDLIQECDAVLLDYDPAVYRFNGSGIAWESIACGVPILAPAGTTVSRLVREYRTGATFCPHVPDSKYEQLDIMRSDFSTYSDNARQAAVSYKAMHGTEKFADRILSMAAADKP